VMNKSPFTQDELIALRALADKRGREKALCMWPAHMEERRAKQARETADKIFREMTTPSDRW
jgi:hypothetical protein